MKRITICEQLHGEGGAVSQGTKRGFLLDKPASDEAMIRSTDARGRKPATDRLAHALRRNVNADQNNVGGRAVVLRPPEQRMILNRSLVGPGRVSSLQQASAALSIIQAASIAGFPTSIRVDE